jgi:threonine/homoserine/homoserine lactone efflux protein
MSGELRIALGVLVVAMGVAMIPQTQLAFVQILAGCLLVYMGARQLRKKPTGA